MDGVRGCSRVSYLAPLRLHFAGRFQAAISTVNNDPVHFESSTFRPEYQERQTGNTPDTFNGWFNPRGSGDWRLIECAVTSAWLPDGSEATGDPVLSAVVADSDRRAPAKLVDLDPEQQLVSTVWGLEVRIADATGEDLLRGHFEPVAFMDIWDRAQGTGEGGDIGAGAMYQSVLTGLEFGRIESSPFLGHLRDAATAGRLSIKFNVDGVNLDFRSPHFLMGRIVGTIGPAGADEPRHFVLGRQFLSPPMAGTGGFFTPAGVINCCVGAVDRASRRVFLDLGNALPTATPGGVCVDLGPLTLQALSAGQPPLAVGELPAATYTAPDWYARTAGVVTLPVDRPLTDDELDRVRTASLVITGTGAGGGAGAVIGEPPGGVFVRADQFVFRLDPGHEAVVPLHATRFGEPYPDAPVVVLRYNAQLQPFSPLGEAPAVATPEDAVRFPTRIVTDQRGRASLRIRAENPGTPRGYLDGQVYGLYPALEETLIAPAGPYPFNQWAFITLLVWSGFQADDPPTWWGSIHPILQQYANLYPVMNRLLDLGSYESVCDNLGLLELSFGLDPRDPNSMPVTRDLSTAKRNAVLRWLQDRGDDGRPRKGTPREPAPAPVAAITMPRLAADGALAPAMLPQQGGKASAASRRLIVQTALGGVPPRAGGADS